MAREYFLAYHSYLESMELLSDAEKGRLFTACLIYSKTGEAPQLGGNERFVFPAFRSQIDRDNAEYAKRCATNKRNGELGGNRTVPNGTERGRTGANGTDRPPNAPPPKGEGKGKEEGKGKGKGDKGGFVAPTLAEIAEYCKSRNSSVDPKTFFDYFSTPDDQGRTWIDKNGVQVRNWKQKIITWESSDRKRGENHGTVDQGHQSAAGPKNPRIPAKLKSGFDYFADDSAGEDASDC